MKFVILVWVAVLVLASNLSRAFEDRDVDWSRDFEIPYAGNSNPYDFSGEEYLYRLHQGKVHSLRWPVEVTGILLPYRPIATFIEGRDDNAFRRFLSRLFINFSEIKSMQDLFDWMGLNDYPKPIRDIESPYYVPTPEGQSRKLPMGVGFIERGGAQGMTFSCATCHSSKLFGKTVIGLSNRFMRANSIFVKGKKAAKAAPNWGFHLGTDANRAERDLFREMKNNIRYVGVKDPVALGLDTSLAQVSLSLARRAKDDYASKNKYYLKHPRKEPLASFVADSKPATWWTLKYKNKWLSDGSVVSGNPILTNLLWNEIGRGTDLEILEEWINENFDVIRELTTASFSSSPPPITDFFSFSEEDLEAAKRGEVHFENACAKCHGHYLKVWNYPGSRVFSVEQQIKTLHLDYPKPTKVKNVGTDPQRWQGMKSLEQLNDLAISKRFGIKIEPQEGYVPPPLVGIWARWPYFHNNSIPNLCALLQPIERRPQLFWMGEANDQAEDFDFECNGYPTGRRTPLKWAKQSKLYLYDTKKVGMSNRGHSKMLFYKDGRPKFSESDKLDLIKYLQTL